MSQRVVICGGTGFIGRAVQEQLASSGYEVIVVSRSPGPSEVGWYELPKALDGALAVVNLVGRSIVCKFNEANRKAILESRVESTQAIGAAILKCAVPPAKWINASATGYYGDRGDELLSEKSEPGHSFKPEVCLAWEKACLDPQLPTRRTVLRIGLVLSAKGGALQQLVKLTKLFLGGSAGSGRQWVSWITLRDLTRMIQWAIENDAPEIVLACTPNPVTNRGLMTWLRRVLHRPWSPPVPAFVLNLIGRTIGPDSSLMLHSARVLPENTAGFEFEFPTLGSIDLAEI